MSNTHYRGQRTAQSKHGNPLRLIIPIVILLAVAAVVIFALTKTNRAPVADNSTVTTTVTDNALIGTWAYDEYTRYEFASDGSGQMMLDDTSYPFTYSIDGDQLYLDFVDDTITDATYTFSIEDNQLALEGGEGTTGGRYELVKF